MTAAGGLTLSAAVALVKAELGLDDVSELAGSRELVPTVDAAYEALQLTMPPPTPDGRGKLTIKQRVAALCLELEIDTGWGEGG